MPMPRSAPGRPSCSSIRPSFSKAQASSSASSAILRPGCGRTASLRCATPSAPITADSSARRLTLVDAENIDAGRRDEDLAEGVHPVGRVLAGAGAAAAELLELIEARQLYLELQRRAALWTRERHEQAGLEPVLVSGLDLLPDEVDRPLTVDGQHVVGKAGEIHEGLLNSLRKHPPNKTDPSTALR